MMRKIFVNLPVANLEKSVDFFSQLGFEFNPEFTNDKATSMVINEHAAVMLLVEEFFAGFTNRPIADATTSTEAILAISVESREEVDGLVAKAIQSGATETRDADDQGLMYQRSFEDLDGHLWEVFWMDQGTADAGVH